MDNLFKTCKVLYDKELFDTKRQLKEYQKRYTTPCIHVGDGWFEKSQSALRLLDNPDKHMIDNVRNALLCAYEKDYEKHQMYFEEQLSELERALAIFKEMNRDWRVENSRWRLEDGEDNLYDDMYDFSWHFLKNLFKRLNWMECIRCKENIQTCIGLCEICDQVPLSQLP